MSFRFDILGILIGAALVGGLACMICRDVLRRRSADNVGTIQMHRSASRRRRCGILRWRSRCSPSPPDAGALSYVRISSFVLPLMIAIAAIVGQIITVSVGPLRRRALWQRCPVLLTVVLWRRLRATEDDAARRHANALRFVGGRYSIFDAYRDQAGLARLAHATAIHPGMYEAWKRSGRASGSGASTS